MIDMSSTIASWLAERPTVQLAGFPVYADVLPEHPAYPCALVRVMAVEQAVPPVDVWDRYEVQVDVVGEVDAYGLTVDVAGLVRSELNDLSGPVGTAGIAGAVIVSTTRFTDDSLSPARPRWVLTVEVTARTI